MKKADRDQAPLPKELCSYHILIHGKIIKGRPNKKFVPS